MDKTFPAFESKPSDRVCLRRFAYHLCCISQLRPGEKGEYFPIAHRPCIVVKHTDENEFFVNETHAGNVWGATEAFAKLVQEYAASFQPKDEAKNHP